MITRILARLGIGAFYLHTTYNFPGLDRTEEFIKGPYKTPTNPFSELNQAWCRDEVRFHFTPPERVMSSKAHFCKKAS